MGGFGNADSDSLRASGASAGSVKAHDEVSGHAMYCASTLSRAQIGASQTLFRPTLIALLFSAPGHAAGLCRCKMRSTEQTTWPSW